MNKLHSHARTTEIDDVSDQLLVLYQKEAALQDDAYLKAVFVEMKALSDQITEAIKRDVSLSKLEDADLRRDNLVRSLNNALAGYRSLPVASLKESAEKLYAVFSRYGVKITKESYATESSLIEALLQDLSASELQSAIDALSGVREIITQLRTEQTAFTELRTENEKATSAVKNLPSASSLKRPLLEVINGKLVPYLIAMKLANPTLFKGFVEATEQVISTANSTIKRRNSSKNETPTE